jgi:hypothetical protein
MGRRGLQQRPREGGLHYASLSKAMVLFGVVRDIQFVGCGHKSWMVLVVVVVVGIVCCCFLDLSHRHILTITYLWERQEF